jgi:2-polyprenyl-6-methoxyphenol hydroxylase-like FAD-dependent oxidoreductase
LCLSRFDLDAMLARHFSGLGGELRQERWRKEGAGDGVVWANGRRAQTREGGWRWFGLKVHARNVASLADLEMHGSPNGYVGITRLRNGEVNVCGLFRRPAAASEAAPAWADQLRGATGSPLHSRLAPAVFDEASFCSVAGLSLRPQRARDRSECCIGDALTMIPPVTGNGMSMAFESAQLAIEPLAAYGRGELTWTQAQQAVARACDQAFGKRLRWARWLQWMMFTPVLQHGLAPLVLNSEILWCVMFAKTR